MTKHLPFEDWILADDALPENDLRELQRHLGECDQCRAIDQGWQAARRSLQETGMQAPAPGFSTRWKAMARQRLEAPSPAQAWFFLAATGLGSLAMATALALQTTSEGFSLSAIFSRSATMVVGTLGDWASASDTLGLVLRIVSRSIPPVWYLLAVFLLSVLGILGLLWFVRTTREAKK
jgi:anti-sigma factor RsiW